MKIRLLPPTWSQFKRWRRLRLARREQEGNPLREFLYLDETGVYSLYSSRFGPIPKEYTSSNQRSAGAELGSELGVDAKPVKAKVAPKLTAGFSESRSVISNANIQATFKEWIDFERDHFALQPVNSNAAIPPLKEVSRVSSVQSKDATQTWVLAPHQLRRGEILEIELELSSADVFRLSTIFSEMAELARENPSTIGAQMGDLTEIETVTKVVERFLVGLVPLECKAVDYSTLLIEGQEWVLHNELIKQLPESTKHSAKALYLSGVTEARFYWKDMRRVLFSSSPVRAVVRVDRPALLREWNAVKLIDLLREVSPSVASTVETGFQALSVDNMTSLTSGANYDPAVEKRKSALIRYANELLAFRADAQESSTTIVGLAELATELSQQMADPEAQHAAFRVIAGRIEELHGSFFTPDQAASIRETIVDDLLSSSSTPPTTENPTKDRRYLEVEFVAVYW